MNVSRLCKYCNEKVIYITNVNGKIRVFDDPFFSQPHECPKFVDIVTLFEIVKRIEKKVEQHEIKLKSLLPPSESLGR